MGERQELLRPSRGMNVAPDLADARTGQPSRDPLWNAEVVALRLANHRSPWSLNGRRLP